MGYAIDPAKLTLSGEHCLERLNVLVSLSLPPAQFVTAATTVVEVHVSRIMATLVVLSEVADTRLGAAMLEELSDTLVGTWSARTKWLNSGFDISIAGTETYRDFDRLVEARNAISHGDGQLTDRQTRSLNRLLDLRKALLTKFEITSNGRLGFSSASASKMLTAIRAFVACLDAEVIAK